MTDLNIYKMYNYRGGQKVELEKSLDQMVVRVLSEKLDDSARVGQDEIEQAV